MNAVSNWAALGVNIVTGFLLTPFIISYLGKGDYGIWALVASIVGYYGILGLGVANAITPYTARYVGQQNRQHLNEFVNTALMFFVSIGLIALVASFALSEPLASFFNVSADRFASFQHTMWLVGLAAAVGFPGKVFLSVVRGYENYVVGNCVVIATALLRSGLTVWLLLKGHGLHGTAIALAVSETFSLVASALLCRILAGDVKLGLFSGSRHMLRVLLLYGGTTVVIVFSEMLRLQVHSVVIGKYLGLEAVAVYAIALTLIRYFLRAVRQGIKVVKPRFANLYGAGKTEELRRTMLRSTIVASALTFGGATILLIVGRQLIQFWVGSEFAQAAPVLYVLVAAFVFDMAQTSGINALFALDRIRLLAGLCLVEALLSISLSLLLVVPLGMVGVALGTAIPCFTLRLLILPYLVTRATGVSIIAYYLRILPLALISGGFILLVTLLR
jgi:O-antigen/teichoic acid export membrane protein